MSTVLSHRDFYIEKYRSHDVNTLVNRKLLIHKQLEKPARTYAVYTDLHGSYEKFIQWVKNGMGYYRVAISEILGDSYSSDIYSLYERLLLIVNRNRINAFLRYIKGDIEKFDHEHYFFAKIPGDFIETLTELESMGLTRKRVLKDLLNVLRRITRGDEHRIFKAVPRLFQENILMLFFKRDIGPYEAVLGGIVEDERLYHIYTGYLVKLIIVNMLEKHVNLGDTFDRGDGADKLIDFFRAYFDQEVNSPPLHYIWGNHDILWLGASVGNPIQCATALRISLRYDNMDFLYRYGFNVDKLQAFARKCYQLDPTGSYVKTPGGGRLSSSDALKMTKALQVLEVKLTLQLLRKALKVKGEIDYQDEEKRFTQLLDLLPAGIPEDESAWREFMGTNPLYRDVYFPTVDGSDPSALTEEEQQIIEDLIRQFTTLKKFQDDMKWLFWKGEMYRVVDNTLYYHAALPATPEGELAPIKGMRGKELLDWLQRDLKRIGTKWTEGKAPTIRENMLLWYLWCGRESPFFCKDKMATLERAIFNKEEAAGDFLTTHKEAKNVYYDLMRDDRFLTNVLAEFHADKVVMGHTPVSSAAEGRLSMGVMAFVIDGGAAPAYGDKGAVLINTPDFVYVTFHPSLEELMQAEEENRLPAVTVLPLEEQSKRKIRHMEKGYFMRRELEAIDHLLREKLGAAYEAAFSLPEPQFPK
jgi:fructose-1,6-bisphosphatase III